MIDNEIPANMTAICRPYVAQINEIIEDIDSRRFLVPRDLVKRAALVFALKASHDKKQIALAKQLSESVKDKSFQLIIDRGKDLRDVISNCWHGSIPANATASDVWNSAYEQALKTHPKPIANGFYQADRKATIRTIDQWAIIIKKGLPIDSFKWYLNNFPAHLVCDIYEATTKKSAMRRPRQKLIFELWLLAVDNFTT